MENLSKKKACTSLRNTEGKKVYVQNFWTVRNVRIGKWRDADIFCLRSVERRASRWLSSDARAFLRGARVLPRGVRNLEEPEDRGGTPRRRRDQVRDHRAAGELPVRAGGAEKNWWSHLSDFSVASRHVWFPVREPAAKSDKCDRGFGDFPWPFRRCVVYLFLRPRMHVAIWLRRRPHVYFVQRRKLRGAVLILLRCQVPPQKQQDLAELREPAAPQEVLARALARQDGEAHPGPQEAPHHTGGG